MLVPYIRDPETGQSRTLEFLIRFLSTGGGPVELKDGSTAPATLASVLSPSVPTPQPLYTSKPRDGLKRYVGRASKSTSSTNPNEELWCVIADVSQACRYLTRDEREVLILRFFYDNEPEDVSNALALPLAKVTDLERNGLGKLCRILDNTDE